MHFAKPTWKNSISAKISFAYIFGVVLSILLVTLATYWSMFAQSKYFASRDVAVLTRDVSDNIRFNKDGIPVGFNIDLEEFSWMFDSLKQEVAYRILDASGNAVLLSAAGEMFWSESKTDSSIEPGTLEFYHQGALIHSAIAPIEHNNRTWYIQFAVSDRLHYLTHQGIALHFMGAGIIWFSLVLLIVFGICGYITLKYTLKPLREVSDSAAAISPRSIHSRLLVDKVPKEIAPLVESFNHVLDRLEQGYRVQQEFLATAAHELKTPLALIRAQIEMKEPNEEREALLIDVSHMTRQVQQLLLLAEVSEIQNYHLAKVDIAEVVDEVIRFLQPIATLSNVTLNVAHIMDAEWQADRSALFVLIKNLLENGIQHAPPNSAIDIEITSTQLTIRDWGAGMDEDQLPNIFTRFWRGAHRRDLGAGLGMTICREIAQAHNWNLRVFRAEPGLRFQLTNCN